VETVGESHDEIRISATPNAYDLHLLTAERVIGMGDGD
jgi:hypothetical protein